MSGQSDTDITRALVVCDGAATPRDFRDRGWADVPVRSHGQEDELNLRADSLGAHYLGRLDERANDLVRIAAYAFAADQLISRGDKGDANRRHWRRELAMCIPVADPDFWSDEDTTSALAEALGYGTEDRWEFAFSPSAPEDRRLQLVLDADARRLLDEPDCVALLSGGIDSLCAVVEAVAAQQRRPVLVSHRTAPPVATPQRRLVAGLEARFPRWTFPRLSFWIHNRGAEAVERTRRTRGFLVAALGAAVAGQVGLPAVLLADNGYVSLNPPVNAQLVGALNSRGTHPTFLRLVNRLLDLVFPGGVQVENPLAHRTRAETLGILKDHECEALLTESRSCSRSRHLGGKAHCGVCSQCVDRRFATVAAGLEAFDSVDHYGVDIFTEALPEGEPRVFVASYVGHARRVDGLSLDDLYLEFPELEACLDPNDGAVAAEELADLLKRHADEVLQVVGAQVKRHGDDLARGRLPETCLLQLAVGSQLPSPTENADTAPIFDLEPSRDADLDRGMDTRERPRFEKVGAGWWVTFEDEKGFFKDLAGMARMARLLKAPGQEFRALDLVAGSSPARGSHQVGNGGAILDDTMHATGDLGEVLDDSAVEALRRRAGEITGEVAEAQAVGDERRCVALRAELEAIDEALHAATGFLGRRRHVVAEDERARQTVWQTIEKALRAIEQEMPRLRDHFRGTLHIHYSCSYDPEPRLIWDVTP